MADDPEVPDLKKALDNKPAGFAWTPGGGASKAAASVSLAPARARPSSLRERLMAMGPVKLAAIALVFLVGGGLAFSFAAYRFGGAGDGAGGGPSLGGVASSMKIRFARQNDPTGYIRREPASAAGEKMRFDLIKKAEGQAPGDAEGGAVASGGNGEGGEPMNYDEGPASRAGAAGAPGVRGDAGGGAGASGGSGSLAAGTPKLNASASSIKFQGMRRVSGTAGFRSIQGGRGAPSRTIRTRGSAANPYGADGGSGGSTGGTAASTGGGSGSAGLRPGRAAPAGAGAGSGSSGGGGGGGGGGAIDTDGLDTIDDSGSQVADLLAAAKADRRKAEDELKKAQALKAGGHDVQAAYHYDRYQKAKESAQEKEKQAGILTATMTDTATNMVPPDSGQQQP